MTLGLAGSCCKSVSFLLIVKLRSTSTVGLLEVRYKLAARKIDLGVGCNDTVMFNTSLC